MPSWFATGGIWYSVLSLLLYRFRPYKLIEQALGECIQSTADYLRTKASFYGKDPAYDKNYLLLLEQQTTLHQRQELIRELLFKSRDIVKQSTNSGRTLVMIFLDIVDLFDRSMTSEEDYKALHEYFDDYGILDQYQAIIIRQAYELDEIGIAIKSGKSSAETPVLATGLRQLKTNFENLRDAKRNSENVQLFISLRNILERIQDIADRIHTLHGYTMNDFKASKDVLAKIDYEQFISHQDIEPELLRENLSFKSNLFRHSIRICIATTLGYIVSKFLPFGHSYWVLLTIIVILKPAYGLTKKRNYERLLGTIAGTAIGLLLIVIFSDKTVLFVWMVLLMILTYSFIRTRYLVSVLFMTPYILLLFHLLSPVHFNSVLADRLIDTGIGCVIAFAASFLILPAWEHEKIGNYMTDMLENDRQYFLDTVSRFSGKQVGTNQYKLSRKNSFASLSGLTDAFNRMLAEPRSKQKNIREIHPFVVLNHMFTAHVAALAYYLSKPVMIDDPSELVPVIEGIDKRLKNAITNLNHLSAMEKTNEGKDELRLLNDRTGKLMEQRQAELAKGIIESETRGKLSSYKSLADQFNYIFQISIDIEKITAKLPGDLPAAKTVCNISLVIITQ